jgi:hypothetical protein
MRKRFQGTILKKWLTFKFGCAHIVFECGDTQKESAHVIGTERKHQYEQSVQTNNPEHMFQEYEGPVQPWNKNYVFITL